MDTNELMNKDFDGVFRLTNPSDEDFTALWNNVEYLFPAGKRVAIIIPNETLENIQEIRKRFAYRLALREWYSNNIKTDDGKTYKQLSKMGNGIPPTFDEKVLEPFIEKCLTTLPDAPFKSKKQKGDDGSIYKSSKAITDKENPNFVFREESAAVKPLGVMPDKVMP
jgi:hypothetical protein